ncbi:MAG: hypothetical protein JWL69_3656, partial [Phycisphaerales bacterium]|nr:hypothetical protein [Phycisphaerales bacterium]
MSYIRRSGAAASGPRGGRRSSRALWALSRAAMEALESRRLLSIDVLSYHGSSLDSNGV